MQKWQDEKITAAGEKRASVTLHKLEMLWFNTGTLCNLECQNCYIESSPKNDALSYITLTEIKKYLDEIRDNDLGTTEIGLTGGEPFMNPYIISIITLILDRGFSLLILTNAMQPMQKYYKQLVDFKGAYAEKLKIRVSVDHHTKEGHQLERGEGSWDIMLKGLKFLSDKSFSLSIAGRSFIKEKNPEILYQDFLAENNIKLTERIIIFPEMDEKQDTAEITTKCWKILNKKPTDIMCSNSRMIVKRKSEKLTEIIACTLLPYDKEFSLGHKLEDSKKTIFLNHPHCSKFCMLGGASCMI